MITKTVDENMKVRLTGLNRRNREITVELEVVHLKGKGGWINTVVKWTDGKIATFVGTKVMRHSVYGGACYLMKDITEIKYIY